MNTLITLLTGLIIAVVSAWITVQLSLRRFRTEKWWERRVTAYERIIEALYGLKEFSEAHLHAIDEGFELPEVEDKELRQKNKNAIIEIAKATDLGSFFLGENVQKRLKQYLNSADKTEHAPNWQEYLRRDLDETNTCLRDIIDIACQDLKVSDSSWQSYFSLKHFKIVKRPFSKCLSLNNLFKPKIKG